MYGNRRSDNGDRFEFHKSGTDFGAISNLNHYLPNYDYFYTYGPTPAYDLYPYSPARPTLATGWLSAWSLMATPDSSGNRYPELNYYMLYTKNLTVKKDVIGKYGDQTKLFDIKLNVYDYEGNPLAPYSGDYSFKHGDADTIRVYDDISMTVEEDPASAGRYTITYFDGTATSDSFTGKLLRSYDQTDVVVTVQNTMVESVPSGILGPSAAGALFLTGLLGLLVLSGSMMIQRRRRL